MDWELLLKEHRLLFIPPKSCYRFCLLSFRQACERTRYFNVYNGHDTGLIESFPSLTWMTYLRDEDIQEILDSFSAKELSIAWHAPEETLEKLESYLPQDKIELLNTYKEKIQTNRNNSVYQDLVARTSVLLNNRLRLSA